MDSMLGRTLAASDSTPLRDALCKLFCAESRERAFARARSALCDVVPADDLEAQLEQLARLHKFTAVNTADLREAIVPAVLSSSRRAKRMPWTNSVATPTPTASHRSVRSVKTPTAPRGAPPMMGAIAALVTSCEMRICDARNRSSRPMSSETTGVSAARACQSGVGGRATYPQSLARLFSAASVFTPSTLSSWPTAMMIAMPLVNPVITGEGIPPLVVGGEAIRPSFVAGDPYGAGIAAVTTNVNDLAAMGAWPLALVDTVTGPRPVIQQVLEGMRWAARLYRVPVVGGHLTVTTGPPGLAAFGLGRAGRPLSARFAEPGQALVVGCCTEGRG